jgi:hypothetical protein
MVDEKTSARPGWRQTRALLVVAAVEQRADRPYCRAEKPSKEKTQQRKNPGEI